MSKKIMMMLCLIIISVLFCFNIYIYYRNSDMNSILENSTNNTTYIAEISKFRNEVNKMSQAHKLYLITSKQEYEKEYNTYLENTLTTLNNLEKEGIIESKQSIELTNALMEYKLNNESLKSNVNYIVSSDIEQLILKSNETQLSVLGQFDKSIEEAKSSVKEQNSSVISRSDSLKKGVQGISGIVTAIISGMMYFIKNPKNKEALTNLVECLEEKEMPNSNEIYIKKEALDDAGQNSYNIGEQIRQYNNAVDGMKLLYTQNHIIIETFDSLEKNLLEAERKVYKLKIESKNNENLQIHLDDIERQLIYLKIDLEVLLTYNNCSLGILKFYIDKYK